MFSLFGFRTLTEAVGTFFFFFFNRKIIPQIGDSSENILGQKEPYLSDNQNLLSRTAMKVGLFVIFRSRVNC